MDLIFEIYCVIQFLGAKQNMSLGQFGSTGCQFVTSGVLECERVKAMLWAEDWALTWVCERAQETEQTGLSLVGDQSTDVKVQLFSFPLSPSPSCFPLLASQKGNVFV